jgi:uncharacterized protein YndB with AHSA1/START domain
MKVERSVVIAAKPERVWRAWVSEMNNWWTRPYYMDAERVTGLAMEPHLGGRYIEKWDEAGSGYLIGHVIEWLPPQRLAYTWSEKSWAGVTTVVHLEFQPEGASTRLSLVHEGFERLPDGVAQRQGYESGSADLLGKLKAYVEKG